jgi:hypothetical protein
MSERVSTGSWRCVWVHLGLLGGWVAASAWSGLMAADLPGRDSADPSALQLVRTRTAGRVGRLRADVRRRLRCGRSC